MSYNYDFGSGSTPNEDMSILGIAYKKMPNLSVYKHTIDGEVTDQFYNVLNSSRMEWSQKYLVNPVELALKAKNTLENYRIDESLCSENKLVFTR